MAREWLSTLLCQVVGRLPNWILTSFVVFSKRFSDHFTHSHMPYQFLYSWYLFFVYILINPHDFPLYSRVISYQIKKNFTHFVMFWALFINIIHSNTFIYQQSYVWKIWGRSMIFHTEVSIEYLWPSLIFSLTSKKDITARNLASNFEAFLSNFSTIRFAGETFFVDSIPFTI